MARTSNNCQRYFKKITQPWLGANPGCHGYIFSLLSSTFDHSATTPPLIAIKTSLAEMISLRCRRRSEQMSRSLDQSLLSSASSSASRSQSQCPETICRPLETKGPGLNPSMFEDLIGIMKPLCLLTNGTHAQSLAWSITNLTYCSTFSLHLLKTVLDKTKFGISCLGAVTLNILVKCLYNWNSTKNHSAMSTTITDFLQLPLGSGKYLTFRVGQC